MLEEQYSLERAGWRHHFMKNIFSWLVVSALVLSYGYQWYKSSQWQGPIEERFITHSDLGW